MFVSSQSIIIFVPLNVNTFEDSGFSLQQLSFSFLSADAIDVHSLCVCMPNDKKKDLEEPSNVNGHLMPSSNPHLSVIINCSASNLSEWISVSSYSKAITVYLKLNQLYFHSSNFFLFIWLYRMNS